MPDNTDHSLAGSAGSSRSKSTQQELTCYELGRREADYNNDYTSDVHSMNKGEFTAYVLAKTAGLPNNTSSSRAPTANFRPPSSTGQEDTSNVAASAASKQ